LLRQILSIGILHASSKRDPMDHGPIMVDELPPRIPIARVFDLNNQAFTCFGELCHGDLKGQEELASNRLNTAFPRF
jgi:hypothetical protein